MADEDRRIVLLNSLVSRSSTRAREHDAPTVSGRELIDILRARHAQNVAIEYIKAEDTDDEVKRKENGQNHSIIRISDIAEYGNTEYSYVAFLIKYLDVSVKGFPVEDMEKFQGREISGNPNERGVAAAHLVARLPIKESQFDDGRYRCVLDSSTPLTRAEIEHFLCRQLRRHSDAAEWTFSAVVGTNRRGQPQSKSWRYTPHLHLYSDVGRALDSTLSGGKELSSMKFVKRAERHAIGPGKSVRHDEVVVSLEANVSMRQAPADPEERASWLTWLREYYASRGYDSPILYYRHMNGAMLSGGLHKALDGAADLLLCPREFLTLTEPVKPWQPKVDAALVAEMRKLLDRDELWERSQ